MSGDGEWDEKSDLTRIEDLSEFLHEEDPEVDAQLSTGEEDSESSEFSQEDTLPDLPIPEEISNLDDLPDEEESEPEEDDSDATNDFGGDDTDFGEAETNFGEEESSFGEDDSSFGEEDEGFGSEEVNFEQEDSSFDDQDSSFGEEGSSFGEDDSNFGEEESNFGEEESNFGEESNFEGEETDFETPPEDVQLEDNDDQEDGDSAYFEEDSEEYDGDDEGNEIEPQVLESGESEEESLPQTPVINSYEEQSQPVVSASRENFQDLRDFGNAITYGIVTTGGQPPYSLILRNIKYTEDAEDIKILLREHGLLNDENENTIDQGLEQGSLLISQISEYSAIYLAHKMRRFDLELRIGLSDQLHPSKSYEREGRGLVTKDNLKQNKEEHMEIETYGLEIEDIKIVTSSQIEGYSVQRYLDVISAHSVVTESDLYRHTYQDNQSEEDDIMLRNLLEQFPDYEEDGPVKDLGLNDVYQNLIDEMRNMAYKKEANAVLGVNFNITPIPSPVDAPQMPRYKITCTGNAVWIIDQPY